MSVSITIQLPESVFATLRRTPEDFVSEMRLVSAVKWYELGILSQSKAAELAGLSREAFLLSLARFNVSPFQVTADELVKEVVRE